MQFQININDTKLPIFHKLFHLYKHLIDSLFITVFGKGVNCNGRYLSVQL